MLTIEDLKILSSPFPEETLGVKVQSFSKDRTKAMLICYLQHTDVYTRLELIDPAWSCAATNVIDKGETVYVAMKLTVKEVTRENVGDGADYKSAYSDALKRAAMLFGVGRYLYDSEQVWVTYHETQDRFKRFSYSDYKKALRSGQAPIPMPPLAVAPTPIKSAGPHSVSRPSREALNRKLMEIYKPFMTQFPETQFSPLLLGRYGVEETRLMTVEQISDLIEMMESRLQEKT